MISLANILLYAMCYVAAMYNEAVEGPYYTHLGAGPSVEAIRAILEERCTSLQAFHFHIYLTCSFTE